MGIGLLSILSIGFALLLAGLALLVPLKRRRIEGAWMALVGAGAAFAGFALLGIVSPDCAAGTGVSTPSVDQRFTCDVTRPRTEPLPILVASAVAIAVGFVAFIRSRSRGDVVEVRRPGEEPIDSEGS
jgi:hypothetical protein